MKLGTISSLFGFTYEIASASACLLRVTDNYGPPLSLSLFPVPGIPQEDYKKPALLS